MDVDTVKTTDIPCKLIDSEMLHLPISSSIVCDTMDLLAVGCPEGESTVYQVIFGDDGSIEGKQNYFSDNNSSRITALAFGPNGKSISSGYENGEVVIYDIER